MQSMSPLGCTKIIFSDVGEIRFVEVLDLDLVLDKVNNVVVHDGLNALLLGDLEELVPTGGGCEFFS